MTTTLDPIRMQRLAVVLPTLYAIRSAATLVWIAALLVARPPATTTTPTLWLQLLVAAYPAIDIAACCVDLRIDTSTPSRSAHWAEITAGVATTVWLLTTGHTWHSLVAAVGSWAVATGAIQLGVALRRSRQVRGQWFMVVSGVGSVAAGATFIGWDGGGRAFTGLITQYAAGGILWYLVATTWATLLRPSRLKGVAQL
ncbi:MAG TPA: hypothetical protein VHW64_09005 [Nocardioides sp.]|uniref:hypothetical protein n=1 Tax=Nocardioides sp. TaxID=35761 RepID=UPI002E34D85B|nr:hypothetical protein [Nocardioides sp.]HEX3930830.1 hypothetical protein [Nocardioides sp.]